MHENEKPQRLRVAIYCRISLARHDQVKVERQEEDCRTMCERLGWDVHSVFVDNSRSAWQRNRKRPGWDSLLAEVDAGSVDAIVVYHGDRLIRQPWDLELLLRLADEKGIRLASPTGTRNLDSAEDRFVLRIEAAQACRESDNISRRTRRGHEARVANGIPAKGGTRSFGYNRDMSICQAEAALVREAAFRILSGEPISAVMKEFTSRGVITSTGGLWEYTAFRKMLMRPKLGGLVPHRGRAAGPGTWTPILDRETWEALQIAIAEPRAETSNPATGRRYLLSGIPTCSSCQAPLAARQHVRPNLDRYVCVTGGCAKKVGRNMVHLDEYVIAATLEILGDERIWAIINAAPADAGAGVELAKLQTRRAKTVAAFADDEDAEPADLRAALRGIDGKIEAVRGRIAAASGTRVLAGLRGLDRPGWDALPLDRRRAIINKLLTVEVYPTQRRGRGFDDTTVKVERRLLRPPAHEAPERC